VIVAGRQILLLVLIFATLGLLPSLNAQGTNDATEDTGGTQAISRQPDKKEEPPDNYQNHVKYPQPYVYGGLGLSRGAGYSLASANVGVGLMLNTKHFISDAVATYDNGHKVADGTGNNPKGRDLGLATNAYYKTPSGLFLGAGASWSQLFTTNYSKQAWNPSVGGGFDYLGKECAAQDCIVEWSLRAQLDYLFVASEHVNRQGCSVPNGQCTNGVQGVKLRFYLPSPVSNSRFIFRVTLGIYDSHATVTSIDPALTAEQIGQRARAVFLEYAVMYRF
jgi:hypothetical protein